MTTDQHNMQRNAVRASLLLMGSRTERHACYVRHVLRPCPKCHTPGGLIYCPKCHGGKT